jgi:hypothetical protein
VFGQYHPEAISNQCVVIKIASAGWLVALIIAWGSTWFCAMKLPSELLRNEDAMLLRENNQAQLQYKPGN